MGDMLRRAVVLVVLAGLPVAAYAQTLYGSLVGNVTDPSGASVPGAKVVIVNSETAFTREATADDRGAYLFSELPPGPYDVKVSATAFAGFTRTAVQVSINAVVRVDVQLAL